LLSVIEFEKQNLKYMYTVEQITKAGTKAGILAWQLDVMLTCLENNQMLEPQQLLQQTPCTTQVCPYCHREAVGFGGDCGDNSLRCMEC
jgi:hypothetical protein